MAKKKESAVNDEIVTKKNGVKESTEEDGPMSDDAIIDPAIVEDTFTEEFSEYNDVDNF
jgi:hypothetical protein